MSTRSVIAVPRGQKGGWRGRYVHSDGDMVGDAVREIIARDGLEIARDMLVEDSLGWFTVDGKMEQQLYPWHSVGTTVEVPGYGVAFTANAQRSLGREITEQTIDWDIEYVHVIQVDGSVTSYKHTFQGEFVLA